MPKNTAMPPGPGTDAQGRVVLDPTNNVRELLDDASSHSREILRLHTERSDDLRKLSDEHVKEILDIRTHFTERLANAEAARLDAILSSVSDTAQLTAAAAETRASTLANTVTLSADAMRAQVATTAQASNETLDRRFGPIQASIEEIRKFQFETQGGRTQTHDDREKSGNYGLWVGIAIAAFVGVNGLLLTAVGIAVTIVIFKR